MLRWGAMRFSGTAVTAGAAAVVGPSTESSARVRPSQFPRPEGRAGQSSPVGEEAISDDWLPFSMEGEEVVFGRDEVKEGIQDILTLANGNQVDLITDSESVESFGADADDIIANAGASSVVLGQGAGLQTLANFTEKLLARPNIQKEFLDAIHSDQEMKNMFGELAGQQGAELQLFQPSRYRSIAACEIEEILDEDAEDIGRLNFLDNFVRDIGRGLESAGDFLGKVGRWVRAKVKRGNVLHRDDDLQPEDIELGQGEKVAGAILCLAAAVMVMVVAKRLGLLRVLRVVVPT